MIPLALLALSLGQGGCARERTPTTHEVAIDSTSYSPLTLVVSVGDTIRWTNNDFLVHTATAENGDFDSGDIAPGGTWSVTLTETGEFAYLCRYHPPMRGVLRVE